MKIVLYLALFLLVIFVAQKADAITLTAVPRNEQFGPNDWLYIDLKIDGYVGGVQYLIKQNIISVPKGHIASADSEIAIPQWIKTTAG